MRDLLARLEPHIAGEVARFVHDSGVPGVAAAVVVRGDPPWSFAHGISDVETSEPVDPCTPMRVGSLTKPFTAAAILRLRDEGALMLDDPVLEHIPEFVAVRPRHGAHPGDVLLRHLVTHRAGLPGEAHVLDDAADLYPTIDQVLEGLADVVLLSAPGTAMRYSNLGYQLLGEIVARRTGSSFEDFCERALFTPLGLHRTAFERPPEAARGHRGRAFTDLMEPVGDRRKRTNADGGLWSTAVDQARWISAQLDPACELRFLHEMHGALPGSDVEGAAGQGTGWFRERRDARTLVYHQGSTPGFAARVAFSPSLGAGAVVLANGETSIAGLLGRIVDLVIDGVEGASPSGSAPAVSEPPRSVGYPPGWDELLGFYVWPGSTMLFRLEVRSGVLRLVDLDEERHVGLDPDGDDRFVATDGGWAGERVTIRRDGDGAVRGLRLGSWSLARLVEAPP